MSREMVAPNLFNQDDCSPGFLQHRGACYRLLETNLSRSYTRLYDDISTACADTAYVREDCEKARGLAGCPVVMTPHSPAEQAFMRLVMRRANATHTWTGLKIIDNGGFVSSAALLFNSIHHGGLTLGFPFCRRS